MRSTKNISPPVRIGFIALTDAAPVIAAHELGFFQRHGVDATLSREVGWATIRDKIVYGELDAAHALAGMLVSTSLGADHPPCDVLTACAISLNGNAVTLGRHLIESGATDAASLHTEIRSRLSRGLPKIVLGVVFKHSSHHIQLRRWLKAGGIDPEKDVHIVIVPPAQMVRNLAAQTIDGFCVGEPWNSLAEASGAGGIVARSCDESPGHPEKVLMVCESYALINPATNAAMVRAVVDAAAWCDNPENRADLARMLSADAYLGIEPSIIRRSLDHKTAAGNEMLVFSGQDASHPAPWRAEAVIRELREAGLINIPQTDVPRLARKIYRDDLFLHATRAATTHENARI